MHILIAADSFKGTHTSLEVGKAIQRGFTRVFPQADFKVIPVADGGEGTVEAVLQAAGGDLKRLTVHDPLGKLVEGFWGHLPHLGKAVIEMASASGLPLVPLEQRNPLNTNTYGTGELIAAALNTNVCQLMIGIGGSATNDGGVGMAQALGVQFLDRNGQQLDGSGGSLGALERIDISGLNPRLQDVEILVSCDVRNPLLGSSGASVVYGPQKGATQEMIEILDANLAHLAEVVKRDLGTDYCETPGAGAAGGLGFGLMSFCRAKLLSGIETVLRIIELDKMLVKADLVITGEGRLDGQSVYGKVPVGVAQCAQKAGKPVVAIVGELGANAHMVFEYGIDALFPTVDRVMNLETALSESRISLENTAERAARALKMGQQLPI